MHVNNDDELYEARMKTTRYRAWVKEFYPSKSAATMVYSDTMGGLSGFFREFCDDIVMRGTGVLDMQGNELYEGDVVNVYYTSYDGEHIHDCICLVTFGELGDVQLKFQKLMWVSDGHNQYPMFTTLCLEYKSLGYRYSDDGNIRLVIPDLCETNQFTHYKCLDKSQYIKLIGNIYETPDFVNNGIF